MSKLSPSFRLAKFRRAAMKKGVFDDSVYPKKRFRALGGIMETEISRQTMDSQGKVAFPRYAIAQDKFAGTLPARKATDNLPAAIQGIFVKNSNRLVLRPRPRAVYGDAYAPVNCAAPEEPIPKEGKGRKRKYEQGNAKKCASCATDTGEGCRRLLPNPNGSKLGLDITILRAIHSRSTRRSEFPPGPSPLANSFTADNCDDTSSDDSQESDTSSDGSAASTYSTPSQKDLTMRRSLGIYLGQDRETAYIGDRGVFSPRYTYFDMMAAYSGSGKQIVTYVQNPISPESNGHEHAAEANEIWLNENTPFCAEDSNSRASPSNSGHGIPFPKMPSSDSDDDSCTSSGHGIPFPKMPSDDYSDPQPSRPRSAPEPRKGWRRLRAMSSDLIKRHPSLGSVYKSVVARSWIRTSTKNFNAYA